jgi:hypothetical protein
MYTVYDVSFYKSDGKSLVNDVEEVSGEGIARKFSYELACKLFTV